MDSIWLQAPCPALRLRRGGPGAQVEFNAAARQWAGASGLTLAALQSWAEPLVRADALDAGAVHRLARQTVRCTRVALDDGALLWLQPQDDAGGAAALAGRARDADVRRATEFLDRALVLAGVSVWRVDLKTRRIHFNAVGFHVAGMPQDAAGVDMDAMRATVHPDDLGAIVRGADEALAGDQVVDVVARYRNIDGSWRTLLTRRVAERDAQGLAIGLAGVSMDLSTQVAEREHAERLAERARLAAEALGVGFWIRDDTAGSAHWDEQMYRIYGLDPGQPPPPTSDWMQRCVHEQDHAQLRTQAMQIEARPPGNDALIEATFRVAGNEDRWVQTWTRRVVREGRSIAYGMHMDVSSRQWAEQRAQHERQRTQLAIDAAGIGIWERDAQGRVTHWNDAMYRLRGLSPDDPRPAEAIMDATMEARDARQLAASRQRHLEQGTPYREEFRVRLGDGSWRWLATEGRALRDGRGVVLGMAGVNIDVTERKTAEALRQEKLHLQQAQREQSAFMARMSHELRTPMNAVLGFTRLLAEDTQDPPSERQRDRLSHIGAAGQTLLSLIDDLLQIAHRDNEPVPVPARGGLQVLCIEDNPVNLQLVRELIALRPAVALRTAETGQEGLDAARADAPDLVLLDLQLPDLPGADVMRALRAQSATAGCRIVALSADAMPDHIAKALADGFDDYWTKPIQFDQFLAGIDRLVAAKAEGRIQAGRAP